MFYWHANYIRYIALSELYNSMRVVELRWEPYNSMAVREAADSHKSFRFGRGWFKQRSINEWNTWHTHVVDSTRHYRVLWAIPYVSADPGLEMIHHYSFEQTIATKLPVWSSQMVGLVRKGIPTLSALSTFRLYLAALLSTNLRKPLNVWKDSSATLTNMARLL